MSSKEETRADLSIGPLAGFRVVDLTYNLLGPLCTQTLGDLGADVVKVEGPEGDPLRYMGSARTDAMGPIFLNVNRNKRSIILDLKNKSARPALIKLIESADVFVHSMRADAAQRSQISYEDVAAINPRIIYASATGYRQDSSRRDWPAFDDVIQGASGLAGLSMKLGDEPQYLPTVVCDKLCGLILASSIGMALLARERTGKGQEVHLAMMDTMVQFTLVEHLWEAVFCNSAGNAGYTRLLTPHRKPYRTKDGFISVMASNDKQWQRLFAAMDLSDLMNDPRFSTISARAANIDAAYGVLTEQMQTRTTAEWRKRLDEHDVPNGVINTLEDVIDDAYLRETKFLRKVAHPTEGDLLTMGSGVEFSETKTSIRRLAPKLGGQTREVLAELGLSAADIEAIAPPP